MKDEIFKNTNERRFIKYFINFYGVMLQPGNIQRVELSEEANLNGTDGEDDCLLYKIDVRLFDYPFLTTFSFTTDKQREDAHLELVELLRQNKVSITDGLDK